MRKRGYIFLGVLAAILAVLPVLDYLDKKSGTIASYEFLPAGPEDFLPLAEFRLQPNPDAHRIESFIRAFAADEGLTVEEQPDHRLTYLPVSLMVAVNDYTKLSIVKTGPEMPGFFSMTLQVKHSDDRPVQLALFERLQDRARTEFPDLAVETLTLGPRYAQPRPH